MSKPSLNKERRAWLASLTDGDEVAVVNPQGVAECIGTCRRMHPSRAPVAFRVNGSHGDFGPSGLELRRRRDCGVAPKAKRPWLDAPE